ncbi:MAG: acetate kinase [Gemmataceae bacterium]
MPILVLNPGSSTLKYRLVEATKPLASGLIDHVAGEALAQAAGEVLRRCQGARIDAIGCRVVHGGDRFAEPTVVTPEVLAAIRELGRLAPLHNPTAAAVLESVGKLLPGVPVVAVFDTAFHRTIPDVAGLYPLPLEFARQRHLRRYGFHGTSHQYVASRVKVPRLVTCHLGNGASVTAVRDGKSVDTSMGLTPLEGLMMGTRSGDIDPGLVLHLLREERMSADEVDALLNQQSGLRGVGGDSDLRALERSNDDRAALAMEMFAYRVRKYIGAYTAALGGLDAIAFTGGIGEHSAAMRQRICSPLAWLGVRLDGAANAQATQSDRCITTADSPVRVWVVPTDEEGLIAEATVAVTRSPDWSFTP